MENGEYEKALDYYPLDYENENYIGNAKSRYVYVSDVANQNNPEIPPHTSQNG